VIAHAMNGRTQEIACAWRWARLCQHHAAGDEARIVADWCGAPSRAWRGTAGGAFDGFLALGSAGSNAPIFWLSPCVCLGGGLVLAAGAARRQSRSVKAIRYE